MKVVFFKNIALFLLIIIPIGLWAQEEVYIKPKYAPASEKHRNKIDEMGRKQGLWKYFTADGILFMEITFQNNIKHGPCTRRSTATGIIIEESNYFNGKRDGDYRRYNMNGALITEGQYSNNRKTGKWITYYPVNGEKKSEGEYVDGKREGLWVYYSSKGKIKAQGEYKEGLREGEWSFYNADGTLAETRKYIKGLTAEELKTVKQENDKEKTKTGKTYTPSQLKKQQSANTNNKQKNATKSGSSTP